ncbi:hypothetical protein B0A48_02621 [Cryoendolithus antarcticus]|uniref:Uncharacterized protein n=1 Tax=Cryoendolithus antarcticus TaxID=1507870 RepID=A0A1V8TP63_9PEZI|nr:hypothetical protein B0A48_02621 [Cryoendolithus antarcticus]
MDYILPTFKFVCVTFATLAVGTGARGVVDPVGFSRSFGLALESTKGNETNDTNADARRNTAASRADQHCCRLAESYASLMGVRQLGTGLTLLTFAYQGKWTEAATILVIIGIVVAGTDGFFLACAGSKSSGRFHAIPGAGISALAAGAIYVGA